MKMLVVGVTSQSGTTKDGHPYTFSEAYCLMPLEGFAKGSFRRVAYGYEPVPIKILDSLIPEFSNFRFPCLLELEQINRRYRGNVEILITGVARVESSPSVLKSAS